MVIFNIEIFHKNLEILRKIADMKKSEFSLMLGIKNVFRKDYNSIGPKLLYGIQKHFNGVDEEWLLREHRDNEINITLKSYYNQTLRHLSARDYVLSNDSDRGSYGIPDLAEHEVKEILMSLTPDEMCLLEAIREMDNIGRVDILTTAINQLNHAKRGITDKTRIETIDRLIRQLTKAIAVLSNP